MIPSIRLFDQKEEIFARRNNGKKKYLQKTIEFRKSFKNSETEMLKISCFQFYNRTLFSLIFFLSIIFVLKTVFIANIYVWIFKSNVLQEKKKCLRTEKFQTKFEKQRKIIIEKKL